jgi:hypothetical protein
MVQMSFCLLQNQREGCAVVNAPVGLAGLHAGILKINSKEKA